MTKEEKLISLLQPKEHKSKIRLFCREKKLESGSLIKKYSDLLAQNKNNNYICRIIIKDNL